MARWTVSKKDKVLSGVTILKLLDDFIDDSYAGRRVKKNGKRLADSTIVNYKYLKKAMVAFADKHQSHLKFYVEGHLNQREKTRAQNFYRQFYKRFTDFLYNQGYYDNYVGLIVKCLRVFMNYLKIDRQIPLGEHHKRFYIPVESIPIIALSPDQLKAIISDHNWEGKTKEAGLEKIRDIFIFGCTVALRFSDLMALTQRHLRKQGDTLYLEVTSKKSRTLTRVKLPAYAIAIIDKYKDDGPTLLPSISLNHLGKELKRMALLLEANDIMIKTRERRGKTVVIYKDADKKLHYRLADHITTHTMRRTAITTMLSLGMPEYMVRQVSGHAANSKDFFRYVQLIQNYLDEQTDRVFEIVGSTQN